MTIPRIPNESDFDNLETDLQRLVGEVCDEILYSPPELNPTEAFNRPRIKLIHNEPYIAYIYTYEDSGDFKIVNYPLLTLGFGTSRTGYREYRYQFGIFGTWHILRNTKSLCAYVGGSDHDGKLLQNIRLLKNHRIERVVLVREKLNLLIEFDSNFWFGIFHADNISSGFELRSSTGYGTGASGHNWTLLNGKIQYGWWIS